MLHALFHNKIKLPSAFTKLIYTEDLLTSSVFGLLQYLPSKLIVNILSVHRSSKLDYNNIGELKEIVFWPKHNPKGTTNTRFVEPDILMEFEYADLLFEMKPNEGYGQRINQWENEIISYYNEYSEKDKNMYFFAVGGNNNLKPEILIIEGSEYFIHKISWQLLLNKVVNTKKSITSKPLKIDNEKGIIRILDDIINSFGKYNYYEIDWFEDTSLNHSINENTMKIINKWEIEDRLLLYRIVENREKVNNKTLNIISKWEI